MLGLSSGIGYDDSEKEMSIMRTAEVCRPTTYSRSSSNSPTIPNARG